MHCFWQSKDKELNRQNLFQSYKSFLILVMFLRILDSALLPFPRASHCLVQENEEAQSLVSLASQPSNWMIPLQWTSSIHSHLLSLSIVFAAGFSFNLCVKFLSTIMSLKINIIMWILQPDDLNNLLSSLWLKITNHHLHRLLHSSNVSVEK